MGHCCNIISYYNLFSFIYESKNCFYWSKRCPPPQPYRKIPSGGRSSNFEILRIFAMFLIVCHHFSVHGGLPLVDISKPVDANLIWAQFLAMGGKVGVNLFVLITGYFLINNPAKPSSLLKLWLTTVFYSLTILTVFSFMGNLKHLRTAFFHAALPITFNQYWFITCYFVLFAMSPLIALGLKGIGQSGHIFCDNKKPTKTTLRNQPLPT